ncbi:MAG: monovalent cation/H+ antiporter subunit E [Burkholderiales bacterium]|nr:monovalent cation/H+ antiporter subunit E [Burkholderiales bacterium]
MNIFFVLLALWLVLNESLVFGHVLLGAAIAAVGAIAMRRLKGDNIGAMRRPMAALKLLVVVGGDVLRSNVAVARIVLGLGPPDRKAGFLPIALTLTAPAGLAALACIVTATPGTSWVRYERGERLLTLHVLDLGDAETLTREFKQSYELPLMEIFE